MDTDTQATKLPACCTSTVLRTLVAQVDFMPVYSAHLRDIIKKGVDHPEYYEQPLKGFKIIVDAGNGSGGFLATDVLAPLGADTSGVQYTVNLLAGTSYLQGILLFYFYFYFKFWIQHCCRIVLASMPDVATSRGCKSSQTTSF